MKTHALLLICVLLLVASYVMGEQDDIDGKQTNYCTMRQIHTDSGGQYGWPVLPGYGECK